MKSTFSSLLNIIIWTYFIPGVVLIYVAMSFKVEEKQLVAFVIVYLVVVTTFNVFVVRQTFKVTTAENTTTAEDADREKTVVPAPTPTDNPPSYQEANENPPPYSLLRFYWQIFHRSPTRWSTRSRTKCPRPPDVEDPPCAGEQYCSPAPYKKKIKRYPSSPY